MDLEQPKPNQVKQKIALTSTIALLSASVGVSHHVKADDLAPRELKQVILVKRVFQKQKLVKRQRQLLKLLKLI